MILEHSGWSRERGYFCEKYFFDEAKTDYEIHWKNGNVSKQTSPFEMVNADWNDDDDVYSEFGANFEGKWAFGREWHTPQGLLSLVLDGEAEVPGIKEVK